MAGMLNLKKPPEGGKITPEFIQSSLHLNPTQKQQLQRIVVAGMKIMFSQQSHGMLLKQLEGPGTIDQKLGQGVAGLMALLAHESKNSLPPNLLIPAGMVLLAHAADFLRKSGQTITDQEIGAAINVMVNALLHAVGIDPEKVAAIGERAASAPKEQPKAGSKA
jgi:hypothetical protein